MSKEEFEALFKKYFEDVRRYVFYRSGDGDVATDIAQDTFMRIWEKQISINYQTVKGLLFKIAGDLFITRYHREKLAFNFFNVYEPDMSSLTPDEELNYQELTKAYEAALKSMPEKQRVVFLMSRIDGLKHKEIAEQLGLSIKAVEKRMGLALQHIKDQLKHIVAILILIISSLTISAIINYFQ